MRSSFAAFLRGFVLPFGATSGRRIVFDGENGEIVFYGAGDSPIMRLQTSSGDPIQWPIDDPDVSEPPGIGDVVGLGADPTTRWRVVWHGAEADFGYQAQIHLLSESEDHATSPPAIEFTTTNGGLGAIRGPRLAVPTTGTDRPIGRATLVAGTVTVNNALVTANTNILLTRQIPGGTVGDLSCAVRVAGTSFTILSSSALDTSTVAYMLWEPTA